MKISKKRAHPKRMTICPICKEQYLGSETGSVRMIVSRLIDKNSIIKTTVCSMECAAKFIDKNKKSKTP